tara:strand:- start:443 stop:727 length:285 start_codon:yes stop_codon:yes gene_type:complete
MHVLVLLHLYGESPEGLFKNTHLYTKTPIMAHARFMKLLDALGASEQGNAQCQSTWVAPEFLDPQFVDVSRIYSAQSAWLEVILLLLSMTTRFG